LKADSEAKAEAKVEEVAKAEATAPEAETEEAAPPIDLIPVSDEDAERIESDVVTTLKTIFDPEIPVDIYELGLIYEINVTDGPSVSVQMTLTSPNCPAAQSLPAEVKQKTGAVDGVVQCSVDIVWEPSWTPEMMSEEAQLELNL
jgi:FeS assembly SUF system protein